MTFLEKIEYLKKNYTELPDKVEARISIPSDGCPSDFIEKLQQMFPKLSNSYVDFLKLYNGISLNWLSFRGAPGERPNSILYLLDVWKEDYGMDLASKKFCPIGEDAGGNLFCLNQKSQVIMFYSDIYEEQKPTYIANSFDEFINDSILGKNYLEFMENDEFYNFLKSQGWA